MLLLATTAGHLRPDDAEAAIGVAGRVLFLPAEIPRIRSSSIARARGIDKSDPGEMSGVSGLIEEL